MSCAFEKPARVLALAYSVAHFVLTGIRQPLANFYGDFLASFPSWKLASLTGKLDWFYGNLAESWAKPPVWHYGPVEHLITLPLFAFASLRQAYVAWLFICYAFVAIAMLIAKRIVGDWLVVIVVFFNFNPLYEALTQRTIELFELMLLFVAYALYQLERDTGAGIAIGTAAMTKFLPLIYLPWLVLQRRWRALIAAVAVIVPIAIATQFIFGWQNSGILIQLRHGSFIKSELNQSFSGVVIRIAEWTHTNLPVPAISRIAIVIGLIALSLFLLRGRRGADVEFGLLAVAMVLLPPHNEQYYFVFLLIPYLLLYARHRNEWSWRTALLALSFVLVAAPVPMSLLQRATGLDVFGLYLQLGIPFAGAALLVAVLVSERGMSYAA
jgi:hypothetical protein